MQKPTCTIQDCDRPQQARKWCATHYKRWHRTGNTGPAEIRETRTGCLIQGCDRKHSVAGFCRLHATRIDRTGHPGPVQSVHELLNNTQQGHTP